MMVMVMVTVMVMINPFSRCTITTEAWLLLVAVKAFSTDTYPAEVLCALILAAQCIVIGPVCLWVCLFVGLLP